MIAGHQRLKEHSRFLFIPGPDDIGDLSNYFQIFKCLPYLSCLNDVYICFSGPSNVLPRCSLPKYITEELQNHIPNAVFLSNPCRFLFFPPFSSELHAENHIRGGIPLSFDRAWVFVCFDFHFRHCWLRLHWFSISFCWSLSYCLSGKLTSFFAWM